MSTPADRARRAFIGLACCTLLAGPATAQSPPGTVVKASLSVPDARKAGALLPVISVKQGDTLLLAVTTGRSGVLSVHGLAEEMPVRSGAGNELQIAARVAGRFQIHFHAQGAHDEVAVLQIWPK